MSDSNDKRKASTLHNPATDRNSGTVWPIFLALVIGAAAWFLTDKDLRRGLSDVIGIRSLAPLVEEVLTTEYTVKIHGSWMSTCSQRVLLVAHEKELDIRLELVDTATKQHKTEQYLHKQPFGQIPVLELDNSQYLFESRAIAQYFARRYPDRGTPLLVHGLMGSAYYDEALSIEAFDFDPIASVIFKEAVMKPRSGVATSETILSAAKIGLEGKLDAYERILTGRHWLAGYNMTLADLYHLPLGQKLIDAGHGAALMDAKRPHVAKWWKALSERPAWKKVISDVDAWKEAEAQRKDQEAKEAAAKTE